MRVLAAAGYRVHLPKPLAGRRPLCCGRTFLSVGLVEEARREAERTVAALAPFVARGIDVVGLEPSCLLGFRDEIPALLRTEPARRLAAHALTFEEFEREYEDRITSDGANVNIQITHAGDTRGRQIESGATAHSYAYSVQRPQQKKEKHYPVGKTLQAQVVVPIATTIAGAVLTRVMNNEGDVKWELDQLKGLKHVRDDAKNAGSDPYYDAKIVIPGPRVKNHLILVSDTIYADFEVLWQFNGHSLGNIMISNTKTSDTAAWGLEVKATINDDAKVYPVKTGSGECAGLQIRFYYRFTWTFGADHIYIYIRDLSLHGDGTFTYSGQWTQD